jgi:hypothetical protein
MVTPQTIFITRHELSGDLIYYKDALEETTYHHGVK